MVLEGVPPHVARGLTDQERDLEFLLSENYDSLTTDSGEKCARETLSYINSINTVAGKDMDFVKKLTKIADHVSSAFFDQEGYKSNIPVYESLRSDFFQGAFFSDRRQDAPCFLEKLYTFNRKGAEIADSLRGRSDRPEETLARVKAHFQAYAGNAARRLSSIIRDLKKSIMWATEYYNCYRLSATIAEKPEPKHAIYAYTHAAAAAKKLYEITDDIKWLVERYNSAKDSANLAKNTGEIPHAIYAYNEAASAAYEIDSKSQDKEVKAIVKTQRNLCLKLLAELLDKMYLSERKSEQKEWQQ